MKNMLTTLHRGIVGIALTGAGLAALALGSISLYRENTGSAIGGLGAGLVLLFAATIDRFESIKGLGMEAKTRQLDATIDRAEIALAQLRELAQLSGASLVLLYSGMGRIGTAPGVMENYTLAQRVRGMLRDVEVSPSDIAQAMEPWLRITALDIYFLILEDVRASLNREVEHLRLKLQMAEPADTGALQQRLTAAQAYAKTATAGVDLWTKEDVLNRLQRLVADAPEISEQTKTEMGMKVQKGVEELEHLFETLEFKDQRYWQGLPLKP